MTKTLQVTAPHYCAGAVWEKREGQWVCIRAAPIIKWMVGKPPEEVKRYLQRKRFNYEWISTS